MGLLKDSFTLATCPICGKSCNSIRVPVQRNGQTLYFLHPACNQRYLSITGGSLAYPLTEQGIRDVVNGRDKSFQAKEHRKKCNVCGKVYCFSDSDIRRNLVLANQARSASRSAVLEALGGTTIGSAAESSRADNLLSRIVDYNKCPYCNSSDISDLTEEQYKAEQNKTNNTFSVADEIKRFKELLDSGVITQEEFDSKKKQLLELPVGNNSNIQTEAPSTEKKEAPLLSERASKKQRIESYWLSHPEEKKMLEEKKENAKKRIKELRQEIENIPESPRLQDINKKMSEVRQQIYDAGIFQGKKKKMYQAEYDTLSKEYQSLSQIIKEKRKPFETEISAQNDIIKEIDTELKKDREDE